jgi:hypothetical protein
MQVTIAKLLSLLIALVYAVLLFVDQRGVTGNALKCCAVLLFPLALIWFPDKLGSLTGYVGRGGNITTETPPVLVSIMGWFFLAGLPVLLYFLS